MALLLIHTTSQLTTEPVAGNTRVTPTMLRRNQYQLALLMNARRNLLLIHTISQLTMELVAGNTKETLTTLRRVTSQDVIPTSTLPVNVPTRFPLLLHQKISIQKTTRFQTSELITTLLLQLKTWEMPRRSTELGLQ